MWVSELLSSFEERLCSVKSVFWWKSLKNKRQTNKFKYKISKFESAV